MSNIPPVLERLLPEHVTEVTRPWTRVRTSRKGNAVWALEYLVITDFTCSTCRGWYYVETPGWPGHLESCGCMGVDEYHDWYRIEAIISPDGEMMSSSRQQIDEW